MTKIAIELSSHQLKAIDQLQNGSILCGGVGSGKSRTALGYYLFKITKGDIKVVNYEELPWDKPNSHAESKNMKSPRDLYIITTAKKRDSKEWQKECGKYLLFEDSKNSLSGVKVTIDSWNNIQKYKKVHDAFFIFDEQRVVGSGAWVKAFLKITYKNQWILLSATPGDQWKDYVPVFVANGFFKNKSDFERQHCIFSPYTDFPKIERYFQEDRLERLRGLVLVPLSDNRKTIRHDQYIITNYDSNLYKTILRNRWDPYDQCPIEETGKLLYLLRKVVNNDRSRLYSMWSIIKEQKYVIVFYNFDYELQSICEFLDEKEYSYSQWNGRKHEDLPSNENGWVYLVQYAAGCEGWNCIKTDTIIFFSQTYSYRMLEQAHGRIDRMNTPFIDLYYYHFRSNASIDLAIWSKIKQKKNFNCKSFIKKNAL